MILFEAYTGRGEGDKPSTLEQAISRANMPITFLISRIGLTVVILSQMEHHIPNRVDVVVPEPSIETEIECFKLTDLV